MQINDSLYVRGPIMNYVSDFAPTGTLAETFARDRVATATSALTSGTLWLRGIYIPIGQALSSIHVFCNVGESGGTHAWACLTDSQRNILAVSADNTSATAFQSLGVTSFPISFTTAYDGLYYVGIMAAATTTAPTLQGINLGTGWASIAPIFVGSSNTGLTTPLSVGTQVNAIAADGTRNYYAWIT